MVRNVGIMSDPVPEWATAPIFCVQAGKNSRSLGEKVFVKCLNLEELIFRLIPCVWLDLGYLSKICYSHRTNLVTYDTYQHWSMLISNSGCVGSSCQRSRGFGFSKALNKKCYYSAILIAETLKQINICFLTAAVHLLSGISSSQTGGICWICQSLGPLLLS